MSSNFCYTTNDDIPHYYIADCTDPSFSDTAACSSHCRGQFSTAIGIGNATVGIPNWWQCCTIGNLTGSGPLAQCVEPGGGESWFDPPPAELKSLTSLPPVASTAWRTQTGKAASTKASSTHSSSGGTSSSQATGTGSGNGTAGPTAAAGNGGLSSGAKIAIGVSVPLALIMLAILAALILLIRRRRSKEPTAAELSPTSARSPWGRSGTVVNDTPGGMSVHAKHATHAELQGDMPIAEELPTAEKDVAGRSEMK
jgi:hypothetical protein